MKTKEEILKEFETYYCLSSIMDVESQNEIKQFLIKALTQTREETIREVEKMIKKEFPRQKLYCEAQDLRCEILDELNKLKK